MERGRGEEGEEKPEAKKGRTVALLLFASSCGFPPSLSKDAQEAAARCTSARPPCASQKGSELGLGAQHPCARPCAAPASTASLPQPAVGGYGMYPAAITTGPGGEGVRVRDNNVDPWQSVLW